MTRPALLATTALAGLLGCRSHDPSTDGATTDEPAAVSPTPPALERPPPPPPPSAVLEHAGPEHMPVAEFCALVLDTRGQAALTLDSDGRVLLWPSFDAEQPERCKPYGLVADDPLWMSLAQAGEDAFTVGLIDTANVARVYRIELGADTTARMVELFALPPSNPLLELHVLDGGQRILTLGLDHRITLLDTEGSVRAQIDERGFLPWQLRVVRGEDGDTKLAAISTQPLRVQALSLDGDTLARRGQARAVSLDRGPSRNDLALSPDGNTVAALRRPGRSREYSIELIDLDTDARADRRADRQLIGGRTDSNFRPRMHFVSPTALLLESGAFGSGFWLELEHAIPLAQPSDAEPDSRLARRVHRLEHRRTRVAGTTEDGYRIEDDEGRRFHASVVAGVRVAQTTHNAGFSATLIVDPLDEDGHLELSFPHAISAAALAPDGSRVAWLNSDAAQIDKLADGTSERVGLKLPAYHWVSTAAWIDERRLLITARMFVIILDTEDGSQTSQQLRHMNQPVWEYRASGPGAGVLGHRTRGSHRLKLLEIRDGALGELRELEPAQLEQWWCHGLTEFTPGEPWPEELERCASAGPRHYLTSFDRRTDRGALHIHDEGAETRDIALPLGEPKLVSLSPDQRSLALVIERGPDIVLAVYDADTGAGRWLRGLTRHVSSTALSWAGDSESLALRHWSRGFVYATSDGELLHERRHGELVIEHVPR